MATPRLVFYHLGPDDSVPDEVKGQARPAVVLRDEGNGLELRLKVFLDPDTDGGEFIDVVSKVNGSEPGQWAPAIT